MSRRGRKSVSWEQKRLPDDRGECQGPPVRAPGRPLEDADTRRIRGIAAQTLLLAFQLAHANRRKLTAWANSIALHGDLPHRRPTRRRKTKPLGTWTPKGYVTQP
ncbi:hypothetical protein [Streptomyces cellulosae]|uniref:hypothetical protein n=1 Tax=Streptomyces cellulosae TaxID=1968 RepID=UPI0004C7EA8E|nr:hypothetical protein [Streptomyces cellulosae]